MMQIIILLVFILIVAFVVIEYRKEKKEEKKERREIENRMEPLKNKYTPEVEEQLRLREAEKAMDKLVREHGWVAKIEDAYLMISSYFVCKNSEELEHCKEYLRKKYYPGYQSYDNERLR